VVKKPVFAKQNQFYSQKKQQKTVLKKTFANSHRVSNTSRCENQHRCVEMLGERVSLGQDVAAPKTGRMAWAWPCFCFRNSAVERNFYMSNTRERWIQVTQESDGSGGKEIRTVVISSFF